jgi:hypothetical protein
VLTQLIYSSQPFGFDRSMLAGILVAARRNNPRAAITGALICRQDLYLQLLEGPEAAIDAIYAKIAVDDRHQDVTILHRAEVAERLFAQWAMLDDPARSWMWTPAEVSAGALTDAAPEAVLAVFERLRREIG